MTASIVNKEKNNLILVSEQGPTDVSVLIDYFIVGRIGRLTFDEYMQIRKLLGIDQVLSLHSRKKPIIRSKVANIAEARRLVISIPSLVVIGHFKVIIKAHVDYCSLPPLYQLDKNHALKAPIVTCFMTDVTVVCRREDVPDAICKLLRGDHLSNLSESNMVALGLDTEWRPTFRKGDYNPTSLLQLSNGDYTVLFRLNYFQQPFPSDLRQLLESEYVIKMGLGVKDDVKRLQKDFGVSFNGIADIQDIPVWKRCAEKGLSSLCNIFFGFRLDKKTARSNWENVKLTERQICYAANDAFASLVMYRTLSNIQYDPLQD